MTEPSTGAPSTVRGRRGLHPTALVVAVVGLVASVGAYWVANRETANTEKERVQEVADQVAEEVGDLLSDVEGLVSGVEGSLIAAEEARPDELVRLLELQVDRSDLITSASLLRAREGSNLDNFAQAGDSRFLDFEVLSAQPEVLTALLTDLAAVPDGEVELIDRDTGADGAYAAVATAFTTASTDDGPPDAWVVQIELAFPTEIQEELIADVAGTPDVAVYLNEEGSPSAELLSPEDGMPPRPHSAASRSPWTRRSSRSHPPPRCSRPTSG